MRLESVDIFGFKSFGERTELAFHQGVTAIVGPNGCGKSNISDAIGWALGEQSAKSLRGRKMEDLIFTGSDTRPPVGLAEVNLCLSQLNGDGSEARRQVVVTRRLYRSGESEYLMDGSPCRLRDIHELFMDTGVGTKAYSIIEQGQIGLILSSKPSDRRALIEEAAGVTKYKVRRRSAEIKLQAAQQNLLRVNDIVYEVERQMSSLKRQAGRARRYRRLRDAIALVEKIAAVRRSQEIGADLVRLRNRLRVVADEELRRSTSLVTSEAYLERVRLERADVDSRLTATREKLHQMEIAVERLDSQISRGREQLLDLASRREHLSAEFNDLESRHGPASEQWAQRMRDEAAVAEELSSAEKRASVRQQELSRAMWSLGEAEQEMEDSRAELLHRMSKIAALNNFLQGVATHSEKVAGEILKLEEEVRELQAERARLRLEKHNLGSELASRRERAETLVGERGSLEEERDVLRAEIGLLEPEMARRREEMSELGGRLASLEELIAARALFGAGARHLLTEGREAGLHVEGSVADAMEVEPRFERAAESFYGDRLQYVLVPNEQDALAAHAHLAEQNVGRSDLLIASLATPGPPEPLPLQEVLDSLRRQSASGLVGLLSDGVHWTNGLRDTVSRVLPDAIVVDDVENALGAFRLAPRTAFVTLSGEVIEPPGILRVGPGGVSEGLLRTRREVRELGGKLSQSGKELESLASRHRQMQNDLASREARLASLREEQHGLEKELVGLEHRARRQEEDEARLERKAAVVASERERADSERTSLGVKRIEMEQSLAAEEKARETLERRLAQLRASLADRRAAVEQLQASAAEEVSQVAALRERVQAVRLDVERLNEGVTELASRMAAARRESLEIDERKSALKRDVVDAEARVHELLVAREAEREGSAALDQEASSLRARVDATEAALRHRRRELEAVRERRSAEEIAVAREELEMSHLRDGFMKAHGITLEDATALLSPADLARGDRELEVELEDLKAKLDSLGPVNPMADQEYVELEARHRFLTTQRQDLLDSISSTETAIRRIDTTSRQKFQEAFEQINRYFDTTFGQLFGGGRAGLSLIDDEDVLESGVDIIAQPPGKRLQNVLLLSGGEKALTAIALMFAVFRYKPSPFCLLDEVDAPLDDANVGRFLSLLAELRKTTQFIIITHNRKTMEIADQMYGVTMEEPGISKLVSVRLVDENLAPGPLPRG